jgi:hypothetical protein
MTFNFLGDFEIDLDPTNFDTNTRKRIFPNETTKPIIRKNITKELNNYRKNIKINPFLQKSSATKEIEELYGIR